VPPQRILDAQIAEDLVTRALEKVVERGTAKAGRLEEFKIAGKTGTSQIYDPASKAYTSAKHIASFTGFVPSERPALTMIVVLADPKGGIYYGGEVCAPIFRDIARQTLRYLHVAPELPAEEVSAATGEKRKPGE
jgi:stage V sporulation protein D (sporulation-specific penicillin-binding protein)